MKKLILFFTFLFFKQFLIGQSSLILISSSGGLIQASIDGRSVPIVSNQVEFNNLIPGCHSVVVNVNGIVHSAQIYVPERVKIYYLVKTYPTRKVKLIPIQVEDFDDYSWNSSNYWQNQQYYYNQPYTSSTDFLSILNTIRNQSFDSDKLQIAKQVISTNMLTSAQVRQIIEELEFESNKLELAKFAYQYVIDPQNYYQVVDALEYSSSKQELLNYIQNYRR